MIHFWGHNRARLGDYAVFSQWYRADFHHGGVIYPTAEHWMMAEKARLFGDAKIESQIMGSNAPGNAKELGRKVSGFDETLWDQEKREIVRFGNILKFSQNPELEGILLDTGDHVLVEASPYDTVWGIGMKATDPRANDPEQWQGENLLGFVLMDVRNLLAGR